MAKSNKPIFLGLFAAGGTVTAFAIPVLVLLTLLVGLGSTPDGLQYDQIQGFLGHWFGKLVIFGVVFLSLWHSAHRMRVAVHDFGLRQDTLVAIVFYLLAGLLSVYTIIVLAKI